MQKLTNMEAQRVINCLEDSLHRLSLLANVPAGNPDPEILEALTADGAHQLRLSLQAEWEIEEQYLMARAASASAAAHSRHQHLNSAPAPVNPEIVANLHHAVRAVCRQLRRDSAAIARLTGRTADPQSTPRAGSFLELHNCLMGLTAVTFRKLATTVEEEASSKVPPPAPPAAGFAEQGPYGRVWKSPRVFYGCCSDARARVGFVGAAPDDGVDSLSV